VGRCERGEGGRDEQRERIDGLRGSPPQLHRVLWITCHIGSKNTSAAFSKSRLIRYARRNA
jgi:hypothetical protein